MKQVARLSKKYAIDECGYVDCVGESGTIGISKHVFDEFKEVEFEGSFYKAPQDTHTYLKSCYDDYMKLPPVDQRICHSMKSFMKAQV